MSTLSNARSKPQRSRRTQARHLLETLEVRQMLSQTAWWSLDEGTGTSAADGSGGSQALTLTGSPAWQSLTRVNSGLAFNNTTGQYASGGTTIGGTATMSFSVWLKPTAVPSGTYIPLDKTPVGATGLGWRLEMNSNASVSWRIGSSTSFSRLSSGTNAFTAGNWVFVAGTFNGGTATLYVNGSQVAQSTGLSVSPADTTTTLRMGMPSAFSVGSGFSGTVDEIKFYDTVLSPTAINRQNSVDQLAEGTTQQKLKKATLGWAVEDAIRDEEAGFATSAANTYSDIANLLGLSIGTAQASPSNLFANIPSYSTNPIVTAAVSQLTTLRNSTYHPPKTPVSYTNNYSTGDVFGRWSDDGVQGAYALGQTQNPYYGDAKLLISVMRRFQGSYEGTPYAVNDFFNSADVSEMYVLFKTVYPDLILPSKKTAWEAAMKADADNMIAQDAAMYTGTDPTQTWFNNDIQQVAALRWYAEAFPAQTNYRTVADAGMSLMLSTMYPDGAAPYVTNQNEVYTYHGIGINMASRYYQAFAYQPARDLITKEYWYYPLSVEPPMVADYSMAASWKHYWNQVTGADSAYIIASMNNSTENMTVFKNITGNSFSSIGNAATLNLASYYTTTVVAGTSPDNYVTNDRNLMGSRGRFGRWSFSSTANPVTGDNRGKQSFVGAMYLDAGTSGWTLNAAVDSVGTRIQTNSAGTTTADATQNETNSFTSNDHFAAVATVNNPGPYKAAALTGWQGSQAWLQTANRMVGLVGVRATSNQQTYAVRGAIQLVSGRSTWGTQKTFTQLNANTYQYGNLIVRVVATDYPTASTYYTSTWGNDGANKTGVIRLQDAASTVTGGTTLSSYAAGFSQYFLCEIYPTVSTQSSSITRIGTAASGTALQGFEVNDGVRTYRMIDNPTDNPLTYTASISWTGGAVVHRSGEQYRAPFLSAYNPPDTDFRPRFWTPTQPYGIAAGNVSIVIPAHTHIVLETNLGPTIVTPAAASPSQVTGTTTTLSVLGADDAGESSLQYSWAVLGTPPAAVIFSADQAVPSNANKTVTATFSRSGIYTFQATLSDPGGLSVQSSTFNVTVKQTATTVNITPPGAVATGGSTQLAASVVDQFGLAMGSATTTWSLVSGSGSVTTSGLFTAGGTAGTSVVRATSGTATATTPITVATPAAFTGLTVNDGSAQRSMVTSIRLTFSQAVSLAASGVSLTQPGKAGTQTFNLSTTDGGLNYLLTFSGLGLVGDSLADGNWLVTLNSSQITNALGLTLSTSTLSRSFFRLYGDVNGNGRIDTSDYAAFNAAAGSAVGSPRYKSYLDFNGDGKIDGADSAQLRLRRALTSIFSSTDPIS